MRWLPFLCRQAGVAPLVRVPNLDGGAIKKALDIGASTVMVPQAGTVDEAKRAVEYAKYPPQGSWGITPTWTVYLDVMGRLPAGGQRRDVRGGADQEPGRHRQPRRDHRSPPSTG